MKIWVKDILGDEYKSTPTAEQLEKLKEGKNMENFLYILENMGRITSFSLTNPLVYRHRTGSTVIITGNVYFNPSNIVCIWIEE